MKATGECRWIQKPYRHYIVFFISLFLITSSALAGLSVTPVSNWTCKILPNASIKVFPNASPNGLLIVSANQTIIRVSQANVDTPLFEMPMPIGPYNFSDMTLGDFDHDGQLEIALALIRTDRPDYTISLDSMIVEIHIIQLSNGAASTTLYWSVPQLALVGSGVELDRYWGKVKLDAIDFSHDGFADLRMWVEFNAKETDFISFMYFRDFKESMHRTWSHISDTLLTGLSSSRDFWILDDGQILGFAETNSSTRSHGSCCVNEDEYYSNFSLFNNVNHRVTFSSLYDLLDCNDECQGMCTYSDRNALLAHGQLSSLYPPQQILVDRSICNACHCNSAVQLLALDSNGATSLIWSRPPSDFNGYINFVYSNTLHGYFMGLRSDKKIDLFDGATGNFVSQTTESVPGNVVGWFDMFGDGEQYVLTQQDSTTQLYRVGLSVDVDDDESELLPKTLELSAPHPNPFNPEVSFSLTVPTKTKVKIEVFDILGRHVKTIYDGPLAVGKSAFTWNASVCASGIYFIHAKTESGTSLVRKATLIK